MVAREDADIEGIIRRLDDATVALRDVAKWVRFQGISKFRDILIRELDSSEMRMVYELTDGCHSRRQIAKKVGVSDNTIQGWWNKMYELGLVEPSLLRKGRPAKVVSLKELGIDVPRGASGSENVNRHAVEDEADERN